MRGILVGSLTESALQHSPLIGAGNQARIAAEPTAFYPHGRLPVGDAACSQYVIGNL